MKCEFYKRKRLKAARSSQHVYFNDKSNNVSTIELISASSIRVKKSLSADWPHDDPAPVKYHCGPNSVETTPYSPNIFSMFKGQLFEMSSFPFSKTLALALVEYRSFFSFHLTLSKESNLILFAFWPNWMQTDETKSFSLTSLESLISATSSSSMAMILSTAISCAGSAHSPSSLQSGSCSRSWSPRRAKSGPAAPHSAEVRISWWKNVFYERVNCSYPGPNNCAETVLSLRVMVSKDRDPWVLPQPRLPGLREAVTIMHQGDAASVRVTQMSPGLLYSQKLYFLNFIWFIFRDLGDIFKWDWSHKYWGLLRTADSGNDRVTGLVSLQAADVAGSY